MKKSNNSKSRKKKHASTGPHHPWRICPLGQFYRRAHSQSAYQRKDAVAEYKSYDSNSPKMKKFDDYYARLEKK